MKTQEKILKQVEKEKRQLMKMEYSLLKKEQQLIKLQKEIFELNTQIGVKQRVIKEMPNVELKGSLEKIDLPLLTRMRLEGRSYEAEQLLKAHHEQLKKQREQDKKELKSIRYKIYKVQKEKEQ